ncbi:hypothetical protein Ndes2437B_g02255 [Nannochloris sp. 'desiccata']
MVSTRSQSRLSGSSLQTGQDKNTDVGAGEVTSKEAAARSTRRGGRLLQQQSHASLEVIAEEAGPSKKTRIKQSDQQQNAFTEDDAPIDDKIIDKVADNIFAALEDAFGSGSDSLDSEESSDDEDEQVIKERNLHWRPNLPGFEFGPSSNGNRKTSEVSTRQRNNVVAGPGSKAGAAATAAEEDILEDKRGFNLSKHLHVPSADNRALSRVARKSAPDTAGKSWYDLPATTITDEVKNDLRVLRLRSALDPKTFYKKFDTTKFPKYFQFGTVVEGAAEFYSSRLARKQRKRTFTEEIMADSHLTEVRKKRYTKMQDEAARTAPRGGRKSGNERQQKKPHRAKH